MKSGCPIEAVSRSYFLLAVACHFSPLRNSVATKNLRRETHGNREIPIHRLEISHSAPHHMQLALLLFPYVIPDSSQLLPTQSHAALHIIAPRLCFSSNIPIFEL